MKKIDMGRPKNEPETSVRMRLAPPPGLAPGLVKLWHAEFANFPPGFFVLADVSAMRLYLETLAEYRAAQMRVSRAKAADKAAERTEVRAVRRQLVTMQRALRMLPSTRVHPVTAARMASDRSAQLPGNPGEEPWERIMREAAAARRKPN